MRRALYNKRPIVWVYLSFFLIIIPSDERFVSPYFEKGKIVIISDPFKDYTYILNDKRKKLVYLWHRVRVLIERINMHKQMTITRLL